MKIVSVNAELFHTDGRTYRHDETNGLLCFTILRRRLKMYELFSVAQNVYLLYRDNFRA